MNNVDLSKSKYCDGICCEKLLWLNKYKPECEQKRTIHLPLKMVKG